MRDLSLHGITTGQDVRLEEGFAVVVRDRIELSTFRFSEGLSPLASPGTVNAPALSYLHIGW
jgi:hypothetical protein